MSEITYDDDALSNGSDELSVEDEYQPCGRKGFTKRRSVDGEGGERLSALFDRVNSLLGDLLPDAEGEFRPRVPSTLQEARLSEEDVERLIFKYMLQKGSATGREISTQIRLPFLLIEPLLKNWKQQQLLALKSSAEMGDYLYVINDMGRERARRFMEECSYTGSAPVVLPTT
ncbi:MAG: hypothetical protein R3B90_02550 [Planctomycetaceae bacterium]